MAKNELKRLRFTGDDDLALLREVVSQNPLAQSDRWILVQENMEKATKKKFNLRTLKDHLQLLLSTWQKKELADAVRSGTEEVYSERDVLLQEIQDLCREFNLSVKKKCKDSHSKEKKISELGREARNNLAILFDNNENMPPVIDDHDDAKVEIISTNDPNESNDNVKPGEVEESTAACTKITAIPKPSQTLGPSRKRGNRSATSRRNALEYLQTKENRESKMRMKEIELEQRKLDLEERRITIQERRLSMELRERKEKLELERERFSLQLEERNQARLIIEAQQKLLDVLVNKLT